MSQGNDFANYASSAEDRGSASEDVWFVAVSSDDIKQMTIDQLDEAFRLGVISAQTAVWTEGMEAWAPLGEVADLDSDGDSGASEGSAAEAPAPAPFAAPAFTSPEGTSGTHGAPSQRRTNPGWQNPFDAPEPAAPAGSSGGGFLGGGLVPGGLVPGGLVPGGLGAGGLAAGGSASSIFAEPVGNSFSNSSIGPSSFAPVTASYAPSAGGSLGQSTGPVALNVDEDMPAVNRGRRFRPERWLLAAAGVVALGVIAFNNADLFSSKSMAAAEKQASAAALVTHPYELGADKSKGGSTPSAAKTAEPEDSKDAPIGSLKGEAGEEDEAAAAPAAADPGSKPGSATKAAGSKALGLKESDSKESDSKDSGSASKDLRGGFAKAFSKTPAAGKPAKASKPAKAAKLAHKTPSRASAASAKPKKGGVARAASAFDPLNGSLP